MPTHSETKLLPYTAQQMYDLVADVRKYPEFLPWTAAARIRSDDDKGDHRIMDKILQGIIGVVFNEAMQRVVRAFEARAADLYGAP